MTTLTDYTPGRTTAAAAQPASRARGCLCRQPGAQDRDGERGFAAASFIMERSQATVDNTLITSIQFALDERQSTTSPFPASRRRRWLGAGLMPWRRCVGWPASLAEKSTADKRTDSRRG